MTLAELRAGNNSMRNIVVPLAQEAKRKGILPENLLSADEETGDLAKMWHPALYVLVYRGLA